MYEKALSDSVLTSKQASVYTTCLKLGTAKVPEIAEMSKIKRTTIYGILDELVNLGLVQKIQGGKILSFKALDPERLLDIVEGRKMLVENSLKGLTDMFTKRFSAPRIQNFTGVNGIKKIYRDILNCHIKEIRQIVSMQKHSELLGEVFIKNYIKERARRGIVTYDLHPKSGERYSSARGMESSMLKRHVRYLPPNLFHASIIVLYDDKVAMIASKDESFGFVIQSREFADTFKGYFEFMWSIGSRTPDYE